MDHAAVGAGRAQGINGLPALLNVMAGIQTQVKYLIPHPQLCSKYPQLFLIYAAAISTPAHGNVQEPH